jgi:hypothetical protein
VCRISLEGRFLNLFATIKKIGLLSSMWTAFPILRLVEIRHERDRNSTRREILHTDKCAAVQGYGSN